MRAQSMQEVCKRKRGSKRQRGDDDDDDDERVMDRDSAPPRTEGRKYKRKKKVYTGASPDPASEMRGGWGYAGRWVLWRARKADSETALEGLELGLVVPEKDGR